MRRKRSSEVSSLDLLLDTICNAFGGVVFIALLMAVLTRTTTESIRSDAKINRMSIEMSRKQQQIHELEASVNALASRLALHDKGRDTADNGMKLLSELMEANLERKSEVERLEATAHSVNGNVTNQIRELENLQADIVRTQRALDNISIPEYQDLKPDVVRRLPRVERVPETMYHLWMAVYQGRLYSLQSFSADIDTPHRSVIRHREPGPAWVYEPIPAEGQAIRSGSENSSIMRELLTSTDADHHVIRFFVDPASFAEFNYVKETLVERGYRYMFYIDGPPYYLTAGTPEDAM